MTYGLSISCVFPISRKQTSVSREGKVTLGLGSESKVLFSLLAHGFPLAQGYDYSTLCSSKVLTLLPYPTAQDELFLLLPFTCSWLHNVFRMTSKSLLSLVL